MYSTDMYSIKSKNMLLKLNLFKYTVSQKNLSFLLFLFSQVQKKFLSLPIFLSWESIIQKYKHTDTWIIYSKVSVYKPNFPNSMKLQKAVCIINF